VWRAETFVEREPVQPFPPPVQPGGGAGLLQIVMPRQLWRPQAYADPIHELYIAPAVTPAPWEHEVGFLPQTESIPWAGFVWLGTDGANFVQSMPLDEADVPAPLVPAQMATLPYPVAVQPPLEEHAWVAQPVVEQHDAAPGYPAAQSLPWSAAPFNQDEVWVQPPVVTLGIDDESRPLPYVSAVPWTAPASLDDETRAFPFPLETEVWLQPAIEAIPWVAALPWQDDVWTQPPVVTPFGMDDDPAILQRSPPPWRTGPIIQFAAWPVPIAPAGQQVELEDAPVGLVAQAVPWLQPAQYPAAQAEHELGFYLTVDEVYVEYGNERTATQAQPWTAFFVAGEEWPVTGRGLEEEFLTPTAIWTAPWNLWDSYFWAHEEAQPQPPSLEEYPWAPPATLAPPWNPWTAYAATDEHGLGFFINVEEVHVAPVAVQTPPWNPWSPVFYADEHGRGVAIGVEEVHVAPVAVQSLPWTAFVARDEHGLGFFITVEEYYPVPPPPVENVPWRARPFPYDEFWPYLSTVSAFRVVMITDSPPTVITMTGQPAGRVTLVDAAPGKIDFTGS
jgi:hypothetical protein